MCEFCDSNEVEDEKHFVLRCKAYASLRLEMWQSFTVQTRQEKESFLNEEEQLNALIGNKFQPPESDKDKDSPQANCYREVTKIVMRFITQAMNIRRGQQL